MIPSSKVADKVAERILGLLKEQPLSFYAILQALDDVEYRAILQAWGELREKDLLARDQGGNYVLKSGA